MSTAPAWTQPAAGICAEAAQTVSAHNANQCDDEVCAFTDAKQSMSSLTRQSGFWDRSAGSKVFSHPLDHDRFALEVSADAALLDYGCGHGRLCAELSARGFQNVVGADYSAEMIAIARREHPGLTFFGVDGYALPFADARFDAALVSAGVRQAALRRAAFDCGCLSPRARACFA